MKSLLIVTPHLGENSTGRAYVWWLLARELGWEASVVSYRGDSVWEPLRDTDFGASCEVGPAGSSRSKVRHLVDTAARFDVVIAVKPLPASLGIALTASRSSPFPMIIDVDDPDLEVRLWRGPLWRRVAWRLRHIRFWWTVRSVERLRRYGAVAVSNPVLQELYGGTIVPHARRDSGGGRCHQSSSIRIAFVGTARTHKGLHVLREAVARAAPNVKLTVTAQAPSDAKEWEEWVGEGTMAEGEQIVAAADVVALPSLRLPFAEGQLPAKLIDAMMLSRVVLVSDIEPMPWAVGEPDLSLRAGSVDELSTAIGALKDPEVRQAYADRLRKRAVDSFSVTAVSPSLSALVDEAEAINLDRRTKFAPTEQTT